MVFFLWKIRQKETSSALCSLNVNKVSRFFFMFFYTLYSAFTSFSCSSCHLHRHLQLEKVDFLVRILICLVVLISVGESSVQDAPSRILEWWIDQWKDFHRLSLIGLESGLWNPIHDFVRVDKFCFLQWVGIQQSWAHHGFQCMLG